MNDTSEIRNKMLVLWAKFDAGKLTAGEARTHIGFARTVLDTLKVDIAAAHLSESHIPSVSLTTGKSRQRRLSA